MGSTTKNRHRRTQRTNKAYAADQQHRKKRKTDEGLSDENDVFDDMG